MNNISLLFLHGWGFKHNVFDELKKPFLSPMVSSPCLYTLARQAKNHSIDSIVDYLLKKIDKPTIIVAWSLGGVLATKLASLTNKIEKIIFISYAPKFVNSRYWHGVIDKKLYIDLQTRFMEDSSTAIEHFVNIICFGDKDIKESKRKLTKSIATKGDYDILKKWLIELMFIDQTEELLQLQLSKLFIYGEQDKLIQSKSYEQIASKINNSSCLSLKNCAHAPFISNPAKINKIIERFICV